MKHQRHLRPIVGPDLLIASYVGLHLKVQDRGLGVQDLGFNVQGPRVQTMQICNRYMCLSAPKMCEN